jgi:hypothetical protein
MDLDPPGGSGGGCIAARQRIEDGRFPRLGETDDAKFHSDSEGYGKIRALPEWRNWQTRTTQNRVGFAHVGSIPTFGIVTYFISSP